MRRHRIRKGETVSVVTASNLAATLECDVTIRYDKPSKDHDQTDIWHWQFTTAATRIEEEFPSGFVALDDGEVVNAIGTALTVITQRGRTYVQGYIRASPGGRVKDALFQDYIHATHPVPLDVFIPPGPAGGHGFITKATSAQPGAGADFAGQTVPAGAIRRWRGFFGQLITGAGAANREVVAKITDGTNQLGGGVASEIQTATLTVDYYGSPGVASSGVSSSLAGGAVGIGLNDMPAPAASQFFIQTYNIQGADQWTGVGVFEFEEWVIVG